MEQNASMEQLLNTIIKPLYVVEQNVGWIKTPVSFPSTERDVDKLKTNLDKSLDEQMANQFGICRTRD